MKHNIGFHADAKTDERFGKGWSLVSKWEDRTAVNSELYVAKPESSPQPQL